MDWNEDWEEREGKKGRRTEAGLGKEEEEKDRTEEEEGEICEAEKSIVI